LNAKKPKKANPKKTKKSRNIPKTRKKQRTQKTPMPIYLNILETKNQNKPKKTQCQSIIFWKQKTKKPKKTNANLTNSKNQKKTNAKIEFLHEGLVFLGGHPSPPKVL
jgi:hypothetical protein